MWAWLEDKCQICGIPITGSRFRARINGKMYNPICSGCKNELARHNRKGKIKEVLEGGDGKTASTPKPIHKGRLLVGVLTWVLFSVLIVPRFRSCDADLDDFEGPDDAQEIDVPPPADTPPVANPSAKAQPSAFSETSIPPAAPPAVSAKPSAKVGDTVTVKLLTGRQIHGRVSAIDTDAVTIRALNRDIEISLQKSELDAESQIIFGSSLQQDLRHQLCVCLEELLRFKDEPGFAQFGFGIGGPYNKWLKTVAALGENSKGSKDFPVQLRTAPAALTTIGMAFAQGQGDGETVRLMLPELKQTIGYENYLKSKE